MSSADPESLQSPPAPRTCRALDWAVLAALLLLATALAALASCTVLGVSLGPQPLPTPAFLTSSFQQIPGAHLIAKDLVLQSGTLSWDSNDRLTGVIMTSDFSYDDKTKELEVKRAGIYYVYIQLALKRVLLSDSEESNVTISIHRTWDNRSELSLTTHLKGETPDSVSKFSASLLSLHTGARLHVNLTVPHALHGWQLNEEKVNFFGLFRVAEAGR
ncbi:tumor necrosis factor ligand superfamily member 9 isoform X2 [Ornithorhynchus anatinus]|uniref:TNF superfamily member 9 n=1 Tax=Ornithorhynchus anatinus TaxID=9258 RepID=A0A6I8NLA5_ORNAN|nr:tumor necrosis factor ligand superfamily member 9 isoform X2 [Ornithorhynchus anatinus]